MTFSADDLDDSNALHIESALRLAMAQIAAVERLAKLASKRAVPTVSAKELRRALAVRPTDV